MARDVVEVAMTGQRRWGWATLAVAVLGVSLLGVACACGPDAAPASDAGTADSGKAEVRRTAIPEVEPNDSAATATRFVAETSAPGSPVLKPFKGELASASDIDWIVIPARDEASSRSLTVRPAPDGDVALLWEDAAGLLDLAGRGDPEVVPNLTSGEVRLGVKAGRSASGAPIAYTVELRANLGKNAVEVEPSEATPIRLPGDVQGLVNHSADVDVFVLDPSGLSRQTTPGLTVELRGPSTVGLEVTVERGGESASSITMAWRPDRGQPRVLFPNLALPPADVPLRVTVKPFPGGFGAAEGYTLRVLAHTAMPDGTLLEVEPNGPTLPMMLPGSSKVRGYLTDDTDRDPFGLEVGRADDGALWFLNVDLRGPDDLALGYTLGAPGSGAQSGDTNTGGPGEAELLCNVVVSTGPLGLNVWRTARADGAQLAEDDTGRYELVVNLRQETAVELEPNESLDAATRLEEDKALKGFLSRADVDVFAFDVTATEAPAEPAPEEPPSKAGGLSRVIDRMIEDRAGKPPEGDSPELRQGETPVKVHVLLTSEGLQVEAELLDSEGIPVVRGRQQIPGDPLDLAADLPPGRYYVRLKDAGTRLESCAAHYTVRVRSGTP